MKEKKYYWLKLDRGFFKRHDIRIIEAMPNGKDYILFYLKLLVESIDHEGNLRFSETIPYDDHMLSVITETNIDIVKRAMDVFTQLKMIEVLEDSTIYMAEVEKMIGSASQDDHTRESTRNRVRAYRERQKIEEKRYSNVTCNGEKEIEIEKELDIDKNIHDILNNNISSITYIPEVDTDLLNNIINTWNGMSNTVNVRAVIPGSKRYDALRICIRDFGEEGVLEAVEKVRTSKYLQGKKLGFDTFVDIDYMNKLLEGRYDGDFKKKEGYDLIGEWYEEVAL